MAASVRPGKAESRKSDLPDTICVCESVVMEECECPKDDQGDIVHEDNCKCNPLKTVETCTCDGEPENKTVDESELLFTRPDRKSDLPDTICLCDSVVMEECKCAIHDDNKKESTYCKCHSFETDAEICFCCSCPIENCRCDEPEKEISEKSSRESDFSDAICFYDLVGMEECKCPVDDQNYNEKAMTIQEESPYCECLPFKTETEICVYCSYPIENCMCDKPEKKTLKEPDSAPERPKSVRSDTSCTCSKDTIFLETSVVKDCKFPKDDKDVIIHDETCMLYKHETMKYEEDTHYCKCPPYETATETCPCCSCPVQQCICDKPGKETFDEYRDRRDLGTMPAVLESTHPLMKKFQDSLRRFLEKENEVAQTEIFTLRDDLKFKRNAYDSDLEALYRSDHDTNGQRILIQEYEDAIENETKVRLEAQERARVKNEEYNRCKKKLDQDLCNERDSALELDSLSALVHQMEQWRKETESDLGITKRVTKKMQLERQARAEEKRKMDMLVYTINNEVWKLQSNMELYKKQIEIKNAEMDKITDKVIAYSTELEDLELDKKRLTYLWSSVVCNIKRRDNVFDLVRNDYRNLQENYHTLQSTLEAAKKQTNEELEKHRFLINEREKLEYDSLNVTKLFDEEEKKRQTLEKQISNRTESIHMMGADYEMTKMERNALKSILASTVKEYEKRCSLKVQHENQMLQNLANCITNDKAVEAMCNGINKMRDMSRKLEMSFAAFELKYCRILVTTGIKRNQGIVHRQILEKRHEQVRKKDKEFNDLEKECKKHDYLIMHRQMDFDAAMKKYNAAKEVMQLKSPLQRHVEELEDQVKSYRKHIEGLQQQWLRLQGHVVKLTEQHHKTISEIGLISKQIHICEQKDMFNKAQIDIVRQECAKQQIILRNLGGRLQVLENARNVTREQNDITQHAIVALTYEYSTGLKDAESELVKLEEEIGILEKEKENLTLNLDHLQREALAWQRKGTQAVALKRSIRDAKASFGEIGRMKNEIRRMEVRRDHLRRTAEKLSEDLSSYVDRRESALEKTRASAAVEKARGIISNKSQPSIYKHKLRLVKADVARVTKDLSDNQEKLNKLQQKETRLLQDIKETSALNTELQERVAQLLKDIQEAKRNKQWVLERVVRRQRLAAELKTAIKRESLRMKRSNESIMEDYKQARDLNSKLRYINKVIMRDYPYLEEKFLVISNTLNIESPSSSPRLLEEATCDIETECVLAVPPYCKCL